MKPTEQDIIDAAENACTNRFSVIKGNHFRDIAMEEAAFTDGHIAGAQWAISLQPEWVACKHKDTIPNGHYMFLLDNGSIYGNSYYHVTEEAVPYTFAIGYYKIEIPQPPTK